MSFFFFLRGSGVQNKATLSVLNVFVKSKYFRKIRFFQIDFIIIIIIIVNSNFIILSLIIIIIIVLFY